MGYVGVVGGGPAVSCFGPLLGLYPAGLPDFSQCASQAPSSRSYAGGGVTAPLPPSSVPPLLPSYFAATALDVVYLPSAVDNSWVLEGGRVYSLAASFSLLPPVYQMLLMFLAFIPGLFFRPLLVNGEDGPRWTLQIFFLPGAVALSGFSGPVDDFYGFASPSVPLLELAVGGPLSDSIVNS